MYIHNVDKSKLNGDEKITVLYHVSVDGKPVPAITAADDMSLVSDEEVKRQLGFPFLVKAERNEPYCYTSFLFRKMLIFVAYIKQASDPQAVTKAKNTWLVIGISIIALLVFLLFLAFCTLAFAKRKRPPSNVGTENRQHVFERGVGQDNKGFIPDCQRKQSPTYIDFRKHRSKSGKIESRSESSLSSSR